MLFQNSIINTEELPTVDKVDFHRLSPSSRTVSYISTLLFFAFLTVVWALIYIFSTGLPTWITQGSMAFVLLLFILSMALVNSRYRMAGYALRSHDIMHKSGIFWHSTTILPYSRIQHIEISQGPVQSAFGIATLRIYTAGGTRSDLTIDGLEYKKAGEIKEFVADKISDNQINEPLKDSSPLRSEEK